MDTHEVLRMLVEAERALQKHDCAAAYAAVLDAESELLRLERELLARQGRICRKVA